VQELHLGSGKKVPVSINICGDNQKRELFKEQKELAKQPMKAKKKSGYLRGDKSFSDS